MKLSEIPFDNTIGLKGLELLRKKPPSGMTYGVSFSAIRRSMTGGLEIDTYANQPCHGRLRGKGMFEMCATAITKGSMDGLYEFFINGTDFGRFILNRDKYQEDGFIAVTGDLWYPFQNCLNIFARQSREGYGKWMQKQFDEFISMGVPPLVALLIVSSTTMYKDYSPDTTNVSYRSTHSLTAGLSMDGLRNFFAGYAVGYVHNTENKPTITPIDFERGVYVWEKDHAPPRFENRWLNVCWDKNEEDVLKKRGSKKSYNPFDANTNDAYPAFRRNEFNDFVLPFLLDVYYSVQGRDQIATPSRGKTSTGPAGEPLRSSSSGIVETIQEYGNAFARAVSVRN